ncbi:DUF6465 family protein [Defluviitalea saccharophila]|uniref:DUF6465 family protein n=1 Tax=Defluviitalea saccharophila TaxID=879970 RepID=A0ABZ2Y568_9FIRM|nr:hypothetical protein [Candidatus Epulonipiscium sp.]
MKEELFIQFNGKEIVASDLVKQFKEIWKDKSMKVKDVKSLKLYYNVNEEKCYYVVNDKETGSF